MENLIDTAKFVVVLKYLNLVCTHSCAFYFLAGSIESNE